MLSAFASKLCRKGTAKISFLLSLALITGIMEVLAKLLENPVGTEPLQNLSGFRYGGTTSVSSAGVLLYGLSINLMIFELLRFLYSALSSRL